MTAKERQLWYWCNEAESRLSEWNDCLNRGDKIGAERAKAQYISARKTIDELEHNKEDEQ